MTEDKKTPRRDPARFRYAQFWIKREDSEKLRQKFPGNSGGTCWRDVIAAALAAQPRW